MMQVEALASQSEEVRRGAARLAQLVDFTEGAQAFWRAYLEAVASVFSARRVLLVARQADGGWSPQYSWPEAATDRPGDAMRILQLADCAADSSPWVELLPTGSDASGLPLEGESSRHPAGVAPAVAAKLADSVLPTGQAAVLIVLPNLPVPDAPRVELATLTALACLVISIPLQYARHHLHRSSPKTSALATAEALTSAGGAERLYDALQLAIRLGTESRFMRAALSLANEISVRFGCERVAFGWENKGYVHLTAISHVEKFDRRANASRELEAAMEEAIAQDVELAWPVEEESRVVSRAHETYGRTQGSGHLLSVPIRIDGVAVAVLTLERRARAFKPGEAWELRLIGEACARQLNSLHDTDRWIGARALSKIKSMRDVIIGPSYTAWKLAGVGFIVLVAALALLPWPYRIDAPVALRSKDVLFIPAPFDGYLRNAHIEVGDPVERNALLVELDTRELLLEEAMAASDAVRYAREAEKAQASRQFADMQIALSRQQQSNSKLELIRHQLANAQLRAPFSGVVVEGELKKNLGAPVRKGDLLVKLAHTGETYIEIEIDQADIHEVAVGMQGRFAFVGRPDLRYPMVIERVDPASTMRDGRNVYLARAKIEAPYEPWWRPGMGGSARLEAGEKSIIWLLTYRTVRYLRQVFWI